LSNRSFDCAQDDKSMAARIEPTVDWMGSYGSLCSLRMTRSAELCTVILSVVEGPRGDTSTRYYSAQTQRSSQ
jgi:hypothetical protein